MLTRQPAWPEEDRQQTSELASWTFPWPLQKVQRLCILWSSTIVARARRHLATLSLAGRMEATVT